LLKKRYLKKDKRLFPTIHKTTHTDKNSCFSPGPESTGATEQHQAGRALSHKAEMCLNLHMLKTKITLADQSHACYHPQAKPHHRDLLPWLPSPSTARARPADMPSDHPPVPAGRCASPSEALAEKARSCSATQGDTWTAADVYSGAAAPKLIFVPH